MALDAFFFFHCCGCSKEEKAPSSRSSMGISSYKEKLNRRALKDGEDVDFSKGDSIYILAFPFPMSRCKLPML